MGALLKLLRLLARIFRRAPKRMPRKPPVKPKPRTAPAKEAGKKFPKEKPCGTKSCGKPQQQGKPKRFTPKQSEVIKKAKRAKKTGLSEKEAKKMVKEAKESGLDARGPEVHPNRPHGKHPHIHVGPVNHIPVK